jgi:hypothetical protein
MSLASNPAISKASLAANCAVFNLVGSAGSSVMLSAFKENPITSTASDLYRPAFFNHSSDKMAI